MLGIGHGLLLRCAFRWQRGDFPCVESAQQDPDVFKAESREVVADHLCVSAPFGIEHDASIVRKRQRAPGIEQDGRIVAQRSSNLLFSRTFTNVQDDIFGPHVAGLHESYVCLHETVCTQSSEQSAIAYT